MISLDVIKNNKIAGGCLMNFYKCLNEIGRLTKYNVKRACIFPLILVDIQSS